MSSKKKTTTKENVKPAFVPKLRFPEFRDADGWETKQLGEIGSVRMCKRVFKEQTSPQGDIPFFKIGTFGGVPDAYISRDVFESYRNCFPFPRNGAVLISAAGTIGRTVRYKGELAYFQDSNIVWLDNSEKTIANDFLFYLYDLVDWSPSVGTIHRLYNENILGTRVLFPSLPEQRKIAECLSSVDELMAAQGRKVDALKTHKKGLMQQLFPREGETQPRLRFPEFQNAGDWEDAALEEIAEIKLGKMLDKQKHTSGRLLPYLNNLSVRWNEVKTSDLPQMYFDDHELDRFGLKAGDVVVCEGGEPGRAAVWDGRLPDLKFQKAIHRVRFNGKYEPKLLVLHLENLAGTTQFEMLFTGGGIKHLTRETFAQLKVPIIAHAEQQRIATCLSSLDVLITAETQKLEALKTHKRGLMQQLFPATEGCE